MATEASPALPATTPGASRRHKYLQRVERHRAGMLRVWRVKLISSWVL